MEYNIENEEGILIQGKGNYCSKFKKGKKTKNLFKITILDEQVPSVQSAVSAILNLRKYVFTKT